MAAEDEWLVVDRFRSRADGKSEFVRARIPTTAVPSAEGGKPGSRYSTLFASPAVKFIRAGADSEFPPHPAPDPQIVVVLQGQVEVTTTGCGQTKSWGAGELFIASDHDGIGHYTKIAKDTVILFLPFGDLDLDAWTIKS